MELGAIVDTVDENDVKRRFEIVGEDEADPNIGKLSWVSPRRSPERRESGDPVVWKRPAGDLELEIVKITYPAH